MSTPTIKITLTEPTGYQVDGEQPMSTRTLEAPHEPECCYPGLREHEKQPSSTAVQVEGFLRGAGYRLPVMLGYDRLQAELTDANKAVSAAGARANTASSERDRWKAYAIWLERRCQSNGLSINTPKLRELRPEPREES